MTMMIERRETIPFKEVVRCYDFANSPAAEPCGEGELKKLLAELEGRKEAEFIRFTDRRGDVYYLVKFFDEEESWLLSELGYNSEIGLHLLPLVTFKCVKCGRTLTRRVPSRIYKQGYSDWRRGGCYHEYRPESEK